MFCHAIKKHVFRVKSSHCEVIVLLKKMHLVSQNL